MFSCPNTGLVFVLQQQEQDPTNLYIANLPMHFTEKHLENMFKDYGTVISTRILRKPDGFSRCVGFARMESKDKCEQIINTFNNKMLSGELGLPGRWKGEEGGERGGKSV